MSKQTAMQDLREDLLESILKVNSRLDFLDNITDENVRNLCKTMVDTTLKGIVKRIDDELLDMEREQIVEAVDSVELTNRYYYRGGSGFGDDKAGKEIRLTGREYIGLSTTGEQFYNETYKGGDQ